MRPTNRHSTKTYLEPGTVLIIKQVLLGLSAFTVVGFLVWLTAFVTKLETFTINQVEVSGGLTISHNEVRHIVDETLAGTYLGIIPRRFAYLFPAEEVLGKVVAIPRIKDVDVVRETRNVLRISFGEYEPDTLWCDKDDLSHCLFLDENGFAFAPSPKLVGESMLRFVSPELSLATGTSPFMLGDYQSALVMVRQLESIEWYVSRVEINSARDVFYTLSAGGELRVTLSDDPKQPFENLQAILGSKEFSHLKPGNFQYLDLRFGSRVFVNEELLSEMATSTASSTDSASTTPAVE